MSKPSKLAPETLKRHTSVADARRVVDDALRRNTRRDFLTASGAAALLAAVAAVYPPDVVAQARYRLRRKPAPPPSATKNVITASDITFLGFYAMPYVPGNPTGAGSVVAKGSSPMSITRRTDNGNFLVMGGGQGGQGTTGLARLYEVALPASEPSTSLASAPSLTYVTRWGTNFMAGNDDPADSYTALSLFWDENATGGAGVYSTYQTSYQVYNSPCLMFTELTGSATATTYGPWRTNIGSKVFAGNAFSVPQTWADDYLDGHTIATSTKAFGGAGHSHGVSIMQSDLDDFAPRTAAVNTGPYGTTIGTDYAITAESKIYHDKTHRMATTAVYKNCTSIAGEPDYPKYSCALGGTADYGDQIFGSDDPSDGTGDTVSAACFVDLDDKWGVLNFTQIVDTPTGYTAPFDADGVSHRGYAALGGTNGYVDADGERCCCHGQPDYGNSGSPGPFSHTAEQHVDIYDPSRLSDIISLGLPINSLEGELPDTRIKLRDLIPTYPFVGSGSGGNGFGNGVVVDNDNRRVYICLRTFKETAGTTEGTTYRGVMLVFGIA